MTGSSEERQEEARLRVGAVIDGRYELLELSAAGGMGYVYRARDSNDGAVVALKVLASEFSDAPRFAREAEMLARVEYPGIVRYIAHGNLPGGEKYLVMEWLNGSDLSTRLSTGTLGAEETLAIALGAAQALGAAHACGIIHRDLKPSNLFLVDDRLTSLKLLDFGIARAITSGDATITAELVGTPAYMAPEQVRGGSIDRRVDVYGLGAVMFRCLTGQAPFGGSHELAVLAKILLEPPPSVRSLASDVSPALDLYITRMLAKDPADRPSDGAQIVRELSALRDETARRSSRVATAITAREQRVASVVLCAGSAPTAMTMPEATAVRDETRFRRAVAERGGALDALPRGAWLVTIPNAASPAEQTMHAARCALIMHELRPSVPLVVATGKIVVSGERHVGEVIDRAAEALARDGRAGTVRVDAATAELLEGRFAVEGEGEWRTLLGENSTATPIRTLLGKPAACIGRDYQLAMIGATLAACRSEPRACAALLTAPAGIGKTRLVHEVVRTLAPEASGVVVLVASGDATRAASPFAVASQLVLRAAQARDSDSEDAVRQKLRALVARDFQDGAAGRITDFLAEICGVPTSQADAGPALRAARSDLSVMADALADAFTEWLGAQTARAAVMVVIEDLHWTDAPSIRLLESAFGALLSQPLFVLATSRPEGSALLSERFRQRGLTEIVLGPLSPQASEKLVRGALGSKATDDVVAALVRRAAGHPFHLEELVRAVSSGRGADALPDSVLGMVQARLDALDQMQRRLLRAASVFGERFWTGGVVALLGDDIETGDVRGWLHDLTVQEVVTEERTSKWPNETEYRFRHALLRDAAYATLATEDRVKAHRRAGAWLTHVGESDSAVLAEQYFRGDALSEALTHSLRAAATAMHKNDFDETQRHVARARSIGTSPEQRAALAAIEAEVSYWRGDLGAACAHAFEAAEAATPSTLPWFEAASIAIGALGQSGKNDEVASWLEQVARVPSGPEARSAHAVALSRGITQLVWAHHEGGFRSAQMALDTHVAGSELEPFAAGWVHRARGEAAWVFAGDLGAARRELEASCDAFERAHAMRALCLTRINAASLAGWSGDPARGLRLLERSRAEAERLGAGFLLRYSRAVEGLVLAFAGDARAEQTMRAATSGVTASPRLVMVCHLVTGALALARKDVSAAAESAAAAVALDVVADLRCSALALSARVALARGNEDEAMALAEEATRIERSRHDLELLTGLGALALAEVHARHGRSDAAKDALAPAVDKLVRASDTLDSPEARQGFWTRPLPNAELFVLAKELGLSIQ